MVIKAKKKILEDSWINTVESNIYITSLHKHYNNDVKVYDSAILKVDGFIYGILNWDWENGNIEIDMQNKYLPKVYLALENIAFELGGKFHINRNEVFNVEKHLPMPTVEIKRNTKYFEDHSLNHIRWFAFRCIYKTNLLKVLGLGQSQEINLKEEIEGNKFIITPSYSGWTFIIGDDLPQLLIKGNENSTEEALDNLCKALQELSKMFVEIQYFEHHDKSNTTGYFKAKNGKLNFGYWKSETENFKKGRVPKEIKKYHPCSAHEIASIWSIDPLDFVYIKKMAEEKAFVIVKI